MAYYCESLKIKLGKFVIPNPFGPFEDPRFTAYLVKSWFAKTTPAVKTPAYVRDNIPVDLLAHAHLDFLHKRMESETNFMKFNPSGYIESQGTFARRVAGELSMRFGFPCDVELQEQKSFPEPQIRINTDPVISKYGWRESKAWDELAEFYKTYAH